MSRIAVLIPCLTEAAATANANSWVIFDPHLADFSCASPPNDVAAIHYNAALERIRTDADLDLA